MKLKYLALVLAAAIPLSSLADDKIKIGVSVPLSGDAASYGTDIKNALVFANKHFANDAYELVIEDDQCSDKQAVSIAQKLVNIDKVKYVLGFGCSGALLAAAPVYERAKVIAIASATGAPAISQAGDYIFRTIPSLNVAAEKMYNLAKLHKNVSILTEETAYCQGLTDAFIKLNKDQKIKIVNENFLPGTTDFRPILTKFKHRPTNVLFINPQTEAGLVTIFKQIKSLNWKPIIIGAYYPGSPIFLKELAGENFPILYADLPFNEQMLTKEGLKVYAEYEKEFGPANSGEFNITLSFAAFNALHQAIQSGEDIKDYLYANNFGGLLHKYSFDQSGDIVSDHITFIMKRLVDGKPSKKLVIG